MTLQYGYRHFRSNNISVNRKRRRPKEKLRSHLNNIDVTYVFSDLQPHVLVMTSYHTINMDFISSWQWWRSKQHINLHIVFVPRQACERKQGSKPAHLKKLQSYWYYKIQINTPPLPHPSEKKDVFDMIIYW
jgi:hypothetical protein